MTATVIPFPSKSVREAVLEARKDAEVVRLYTKRPDGWRYDTSPPWRTLSNSCARL
jgi:hypothetical protein